MGFIVGFIALSLYIIFAKDLTRNISGALIHSLLGHLVLLLIAQLVCEVLQRDTEIISENLTIFIPGAMIKSILVAWVIYIINRVKPGILAEDE